MRLTNITREHVGAPCYATLRIPEWLFLALGRYGLWRIERTRKKSLSSGGRLSP